MATFIPIVGNVSTVGTSDEWYFGNTTLRLYTKGAFCPAFTIGMPRGPYKISGTVSVEGVPSARKVYLAKENAPEVILEGTVSRASDGYFEFKFLASGTYTIYGVDDVGNLNDVIYARIAAVSM